MNKDGSRLKDRPAESDASLPAESDAFQSAWSPSSELEPALVNAKPEPIVSRLRLIIWSIHQHLIAFILLSCIVGMSAYFVHRSYVNNGLIEIDHAAPLTAEFKVDINLADTGEIIVLPGVGKSLAQAIIEHRESFGPFESLESLCDVPGIGEKKLAGLLPYLLPVSSPEKATIPAR